LFLLLLFQPLGIPALQPSQSTTPSTAHQQQLMDPSIVASLFSPPLGLSFSQVQQPSSALETHVSQQTKPPIIRSEFAKFDSLLQLLCESGNHDRSPIWSEDKLEGEDEEV